MPRPRLSSQERRRRKAGRLARWRQRVAAGQVADQPFIYTTLGPQSRQGQAERPAASSQRREVSPGSLVQAAILEEVEELDDLHSNSLLRISNNNKNSKQEDDELYVSSRPKESALYISSDEEEEASSSLYASKIGEVL